MRTSKISPLSKTLLAIAVGFTFIGGARADYYGGSTRPHGHTTNSDGGVLANPKVTNITWTGDNYRQRKHSFDVISAGATADGVTDQSSILTTIVNASTGQVVIFPAGDYAIAAGRGIQINTSSTTLFFEPGARILKTGSGYAITINNVATKTISGISLVNPWLVNADLTAANGGILFNGNDNNTTNHLSVTGAKITGFTQYGFTGGGTFNHFSVTDSYAYDIGPRVGQAWVSQAWDVLPAWVRLSSYPVSTDMVLDNLFLEQDGPSVTSAETDGAKFQGFDGGRISNIEIQGGGNGSVTGAVLIISSMSNTVIENVILRGSSAGSASTGFIVGTSTTGNVSCSNFQIVGPFLGNAVYFSVEGSAGLTLDRFSVNGDVSGVTNPVVHSSFTWTNSQINGSLVMVNSTFTYSKLYHLEVNGPLQLSGHHNKLFFNTSLKAGGDSFYIVGSTNTLFSNYSLLAGAYGFRLEGTNNSVVANFVDTPGTGGYIVGSASYVNNSIGPNYGNTVTSNSGTGTTSFRIPLGPAGNFLVTGTGSPESSITAPIGSVYFRVDGSSTSTQYNKVSGVGNTGWSAR